MKLTHLSQHRRCLSAPLTQNTRQNSEAKATILLDNALAAIAQELGTVFPECFIERTKGTNDHQVTLGVRASEGTAHQTITLYPENNEHVLIDVDTEGQVVGVELVCSMDEHTTLKTSTLPAELITAIRAYIASRQLEHLLEYDNQTDDLESVVLAKEDSDSIAT